MKKLLPAAACLLSVAVNAQTTFNPSGTGPTGTIQTYVVPSNVYSISIEAWGAQGGNPNGGKGARMKGNFAVLPGDTMKIVVGHQGIVNNCGGSNSSGGGGGGSFVWKGNGSSAVLLVAAGGGGGGNMNWTNDTITRRGLDADTLQDGVKGNSNLSANGGTAGNGGFGNAPSGTGSGGAGWLTAGQNSTYGNGCTGGQTKFTFIGGNGSTTFGPGGEGGFGGGGGAVCGCGGGGGYSGGGAGEGQVTRAGGGGGGSYNIGTARSNSKGVQTGSGKVVIAPVISTSVNEANDAGELLVSPNPTKNSITIAVSFAGKRDMKLVMTNVLGETVKTLDAASVYGTYSNSFDISALPEGVYFVNVTTSSGTLTKRIVKLD